jgi:4a-hydroxytetrahydrobiopterin dehydratase
MMATMPDLLPAPALAAALTHLPRWAGGPTGIARTVEAASFPAAIALVDAVALVAEETDHHPDIDIRWRTVTFTLCTHSAGGVTALDLRLAEAIDRLTDGRFVGR